MFVISLGSGSSGNATLLQAASGESILIDCGLAPPRLFKQLAQVGVAPGALRAVVLTHMHGDHMQAAPVLAGRFGVPVYAPPLTALDTSLAALRPRTYTEDTAWQIGGFTITPYCVPHDADDTYGFGVAADGVRVALFTDLGSDAEGVVSALARADLLIVEANHDATMLKEGDYPWWLKSRIGGSNGHLSNEQCAALLARALTNAHARTPSDERPRDIWLAHLSAHNNTPARAVESVTAILHAAGQPQHRVVALPRHDLGPAWEMIRATQLPLFGEVGSDV